MRLVQMSRLRQFVCLCLVKQRLIRMVALLRSVDPVAPLTFVMNADLRARAEVRNEHPKPGEGRQSKPGKQLGKPKMGRHSSPRASAHSTIVRD
ncbi:hypothetical protein GGD66_007991 [Bradyrhizobium sp. CIR48]|nr:hypothetical protein [Bradyrhizobium sp. CIR18]MBB4429389.1 hypothetical protein [Bradyrhizobium sp. CIR48]